MVLSGVPQQLQPRTWSSVECLGTQFLSLPRLRDTTAAFLFSQRVSQRLAHRDTHTKLRTHTPPTGTPHSWFPQIQVWTLCCPDTLSHTWAPIADRLPSLAFASRYTCTLKVMIKMQIALASNNMHMGPVVLLQLLVLSPLLAWFIPLPPAAGFGHTYCHHFSGWRLKNTTDSSSCWWNPTDFGSWHLRPWALTATVSLLAPRKYTG